VSPVMLADLPLPYPFELGFMQRALIACVAVGAFAPTIGVFLVQKRMSLIGDGIGHVAFAGVGAGLLLGWAPLWMALAFAAGGALGVEWFRSRRTASGDVALAILFYSGLALGVVLISLARPQAATSDGYVNPLTYLFGQPLTVRPDELVAIVGLGIVIVAVVLTLRRSLFSVVTDEDWSRVAGLPVGALNAALAVLTAVAVVAAMRIVGILLVAAMMVLPVASAQLVARSFRVTLVTAIGVGVTSAVVGLAVSRLWGLAPSGAIVLVAAAIFLTVAFAARLSGVRAPEEATV
jgi:zinc transport system permease protein